MSETNHRLTISLATEQQRETIYRLRHEVYACELGQYAPNPEGRLQDSLDPLNTYIVAVQNGVIAGFISITDPRSPRYSVDKYFSRAELPFSFDDKLFEVRVLTVAQPHRGREISLALMYGALRWVEEHGGTRIVAIGRREVLSLYVKVGLKPMGFRAQAGAVNYELVSETTAGIHHYLCRVDRILSRMQSRLDWQLDMPFFPRQGCFHGGEFFTAVGVEFDRLESRRDIINADVLDAWFPPSPRVLSALQAHLPWLVRTSPPTQCDGMQAVIARARGLDFACVLPGAGSSDLIYLAFRHWLDASSRVLILYPTYGEYPYVMEEVVHCRVDRVPLSPRHNYQFDPEILEGYATNKYDLIALVNPNSPTGQAVGREALERVLRRMPDQTRIWIDETYIDYFGAGESLEKFAVTRPNVVICKSMSKAYALSGLRTAYLCGAPAVLEELRRLSPPWAVGLLAQVAAVNALQDPDYYLGRYQETRQLAAQLAVALRTIPGLTVFPGVANFLLCHLPAAGPDAPTVIQQCRARGLFLRNAGSMGTTLGSHAIRIAVKDAQTNQRIVRILQSVLDKYRTPAGEAVRPRRVKTEFVKAGEGGA